MSAQQDAIIEAIRLEVLAGKSLKEAVKAVMQSKQFNHMTVRRVFDKLKVDPSIIYNKSM